MLLAVERGRGLSVVVGAVGCGKTTVARRLVDDLFARRHRVAYMIQPTFDGEASFLAAILREFGVAEVPRTRAALLERVHAFVLRAASERTPAVLLIDESQRLPSAMLETIRFLTNYETAARKLLQVVLFGQPELKKRLLRRPNLAQRVAAFAALGPVALDEWLSILDARLAEVGAARPGGGLPIHRGAFGEGAAAEIHRLAHGVPRLLLALSDGACARACLSGARPVTVAHVHAAGGDILLPPSPPEIPTEKIEEAIGAEAETSVAPPAPPLETSAPPPTPEARIPTPEARVPTPEAPIPAPVPIRAETPNRSRFARPTGPRLPAPSWALSNDELDRLYTLFSARATA